MSIWPAIVRLNAPAVVGKSFEYTSPVTNALPAPSTAIARGESMSVPPRKVEYVSAEPAALSLNTNPSVTSVAQRGQFGVEPHPAMGAPIGFRKTAMFGQFSQPAANGPAK